MDNNTTQETMQSFLKKEGATLKNDNNSPWNILVVDDDYDVLKLTELSLRNCEFNNKSLKLYFAKSAEEAKLYFKSIPDIALILLDVVMESNHAGLHLVKYIRNELENKTVRIILRTGYPGEAPEKEVIHNYEINDYKTKNDLTPDKLYTALITGLRDYKVLQDLQNREMELEDARVRAENSDKFKSALIANLSHEIRTPLNGIVGFIDMCYNDEISLEDKIKYSQTIKSCSDQLLNLINDIIDLSKVESNLLTIQQKTINLNCLLDSLKSVYEHEKRKRDKPNIEIRLSKALTDDQSYIITDEMRLQQVITNLMINSLKFTDEGYVEFGYKLQENKKMLEFYVIDSGIGIAEDKKSLIFERFSQFPDQSRIESGLGIGLAISKGIIDLLGGNIWLKSIEGFGAEFHFTIPYKKVNNPNEMNVQTFCKTDVLDDKTIMIVEDDCVNSVFFKGVFKNTKADVLVAHTGEEALKILKENNSVDLVLMDIKLPGMDGIEAMRHIRKLNPHVPIIAQTAYVMKLDKDMMLQYGFNDFIAKPIKKDDLLKLAIQHVSEN